MKMALRIDDKMDAVLDVIAEYGCSTTGYILDETGFSRPTVSKRLDRLHASGCIEYIHEPTAFWNLVDDPRGDSTDD